MKAAVLTVSDGVNAGVREDTSGDVLEELLREEGYSVARTVVPDDADVIAAAIGSFGDSGVALVLTTGGTGFAPRDVTPEATRVVDRSRGSRDRRGDPRRCARADAPRTALARDRGASGGDARRQLPGFLGAAATGSRWSAPLFGTDSSSRRARRRLRIAKRDRAAPQRSRCRAGWRPRPD